MTLESQFANAASAGRSVTVIGAGNIGSHLLTHLARMHAIKRVTIVDRDHYDATNLASQDITPRDVGKAKAQAQARRLRRINPELCVTALAEDVEAVPLGRLRSDLLVACLDSRRARQLVNQAAWRLGVPWIDAGVEAGGLLARVNVYVPGANHPCIECAWDEKDYAAIEQTYACLGAVARVQPTLAPAALGGLAASLQALEIQKLFAGQMERVAVSKQVMIDATHHKHYVTAFRRNPQCRFPDHDGWAIRALDDRLSEMTLGAALALANGNGVASERVGLRVEERRFVRKLKCTGCQFARPMLRLDRSLRPTERVCPRCGAAMTAAGFDVIERLSMGELTSKERRLSLRRLGLRSGDVFSVGTRANERHYEIN